MKMTGKVLEYSEKNSLGYIEGLDGTVYMFHQVHVKNDTKLTKDDIVKFDFSLTEDENMPYAMDIEKRE